MEPADPNAGVRPMAHDGLLRLWRIEPGGAWRVSLRLTDASAPLGFADLSDLFVYLLRLTEAAPGMAAPASSSVHPADSMG